MKRSGEDIESKFLNKTLIASGNKFAFYLVDFTVGEKVIKNYESLEPIKFSQLGFEDCTLIPLLERGGSQVSQNLWTFLFYEFSPPLDRYIVEFPGFEIKDDDFKASLEQKFSEITGFPLKTFELLENVDKVPNIYSDPACCTKRSRAVSAKIKVDDDEFLKLENDKKISLVEIEGNICEKFRKIAKERGAILSDKAWYWALGKSFQTKGVF